MATRDIIVIGASAGGIETLERLVGALPQDLPAAVFITQHLSSNAPAILPDILNRFGSLPAVNALDREQIHPGRIYVAPPDYHLVLEPGFVRLSHGPRENLQRPSLNAVFRSAAQHYAERVSGVVLTGLLDDGAAGLWEIQQRNGATIVQDPEEATYRSMPDNAIRGLTVQYIVRIAEMAPLLVRLAMSDNNDKPIQAAPCPAIAPSGQSCPECGGVMVVARLGALREYRCHTGHRLGLQNMIAEKHREVELALDIALSQSEELSALLQAALDEGDSQRSLELGNNLSLRSREQEILRNLLGYPKKTI